MLTAVLSASLWILVLSGPGGSAKRRPGDPDSEESWSESVSRARCASRCLSLHSVGALSTPLQNNGSLGWCQADKQCSKCLEPCKESWGMDRKINCNQFCERAFPRKNWECVTSCEFLQSALAVKQGTCLPPERASGFAAACVEGCDHDRECSAQKKCCFNGCGHTCQAPKDLYKSVPLKPRKELSLRELPSGQLEVRWSSRFNISAEPVVYVLQRRWNFGIQPSEDSATSWQVVAQTTEQGARLSDIRPGRWYQFRVAATNTRGTRGFTTPSRHIHASRDPANPPAPAELRVANLSFGPGRVVSARLQWTMPPDLDVPVHHYKVSWSWSHSGQFAASPLNKKRKIVQQNHIDLDNMRSNRTYSVEVQAVSFWGQTPLKGPRAIIHFSTQHSMSSHTGHIFPVQLAAAAGAPRDDIMDVGMPFYQDGQLQVHVYWQKTLDPSEYYLIHWGPEFCGHNQTKPMETITTQESFVTLRSLLFSCKYKVLLQPVSKRSPSLSQTTSFFTPSCALIRDKSPKAITCPGEKAKSRRKVVAKAANLTVSFEIWDGNVTGLFSWDVSTDPPHQPLIGYQVTWLELVPNNLHSNKMPQSLISQSQVLPPERNILVLSDMHPGSLYRLEVQAITEDGDGPTTSRTFQTPSHQSIPKHSENRIHIKIDFLLRVSLKH
uniref:Anosmin 1a n=1 Tax=Tetraodon nigroviridis TaxID=99883 RepID=H3DAG6_TETNG